ncbi:MAG: hypothetical protein MUF64_28110 [Polyangiaceae bacterium]|nr:hypothetical protein [Polyangiaceae bacterium]
MRGIRRKDEGHRRLRHPGVVDGSHNASWHSIWDPVSSGTISTCGGGFYGSSKSIPLSGFVDVDGDGRSDPFHFNFANDNGTGNLVRRTSNSTTCGAETFSYVSSLYPKDVVFFGSDLTGDGKPELFVVDSHAMTWRVFVSEYPSYQNIYTDLNNIVWGSPTATLL